MLRTTEGRTVTAVVRGRESSRRCGARSGNCDWGTEWRGRRGVTVRQQKTERRQEGVTVVRQKK